MIVLLGLILVIILSFISFFLARSSMKDYQDSPHEHLRYGLYLIRSPSLFNRDFLADLSRRAGEQEVIFSLERLFKGPSGALLIYAPKDLIEQFDYLNLQELEDYTQKVNINNCLAWEIEPKQKIKGQTGVFNRQPAFLKDLHLSERDQFYFQVVCQLLPRKKGGVFFQVTLRGVVISEDALTRTNIAKAIDVKMDRETKFHRRKKTIPSSQIFHAYRRRNIKPHEVAPFIIKGDDVVSLLTQ